MIASSLPPPGAITFDHQTISSVVLLALVYVLEVEPSPLPDHAVRIVFPHVSQLDLSLDTFFRQPKTCLIVPGTND